MNYYQNTNAKQKKQVKNLKKKKKKLTMEWTKLVFFESLLSAFTNCAVSLKFRSLHSNFGALAFRFTNVHCTLSPPSSDRSQNPPFPSIPTSL